MDALDAHKMGKYGLSIHALLPQIEGIITDSVYEELPTADIPYKEKSKIAKFHDLIITDSQSTFTHKRIIDSAIDFMLGGRVLGDFNWEDDIDESFPNRNIVTHGRYEETFFSEENSIKSFLILDTIHHIMFARCNDNTINEKSS
jgi:hypothetical protein